MPLGDAETLASARQAAPAGSTAAAAVDGLRHALSRKRGRDTEENDAIDVDVGDGVPARQLPRIASTTAIARPPVPPAAGRAGVGADVVGLLTALDRATRLRLLSRLPKGWRPGNPLPEGTPDLAALLKQMAAEGALSGSVGPLPSEGVSREA